jgi:D-alanyl-D-alanine carboxypeptidase
MVLVRLHARIAVLWVLGFLALAAPAAAGPATVVVDAATGAVLASAQPTALWRPASLTKLMSLYVVFQDVAAARLGLDEKLTVSAYAAAMPPSSIGLAVGEHLTVRQAILATITRSANDAVVALAQRVAGDETAFAARMTDTAKKLGMTGSVFRNASGLPDPEQTTTARDMAVLALALIRDFPQFYGFFGARGVAFRGGMLPTINAILQLYPGADGLKTGFTCGSGYNLVASAVRGDRRIIAVILGGLTSGQRFREATDLLDTGFAAPVAPEEDPLTIAQLMKVPVAPPPQQLSAEDCTPGWSLRANGAVAGRLPGWGILLGGFRTAEPTRALLASSLRALPANLRRGHADVFARQMEGGKVYRAAVIGLTGAQAAAACRALVEGARFCRVLPPAVLNNPRAAWY